MINEDHFDRIIQFQQALVEIVENADSMDSDYYSTERKFLIDNYPNVLPEFLKSCRILENFKSHLYNISSGYGSWNIRRTFIYSEFKDLLNYIEFGTEKESFNKESINIVIREEIFNHIQGLLSDGHYFNAVEEAYKIVREKLKEITGTERATDAFSKSNYQRIFGHEPVDDAEKDFFEGIKFLNMAIQFLRNEKSHTPAKEIDKNLALHYIVLASLAYQLINRD